MTAKHLMGLINKYAESQGVFTARGQFAYWFNGKRFEKWCAIPHDWILLPGPNLEIITRNSSLIRIYKNKRFVQGAIYRHTACFKHEVCLKNKNSHIIFRTMCYSLFETYLVEEFPQKKKLSNKPSPSTANGRFLHYKDKLYYFAFHEPTEVYDIKTEQWSTIENVSNEKYDDMVLLNGLFYAILDLKVVFVYNP